MYDDDYPKQKIGHGNPYYCCASCGRSVPEINGQLSNHREDCEYRKSKDQEALLQLVNEENFELRSTLRKLFELNKASLDPDLEKKIKLLLTN